MAERSRVGTPIADGRETRIFYGKEYLLGSGLMAAAGRITIAEVEELVETAPGYTPADIQACTEPRLIMQ